MKFGNVKTGILIGFILFFANFVFAQEIPYSEGQVYVCPLATKTEEINPRCGCRIDLVLGETVTSTCNGEDYEMTLTITEYEGKEYYTILGFENGGAGVNLKPEAKISAPSEAYLNQEILFDGSQSSDPNQDPLDFFWDFGDGNSGQGQKVVHAYRSKGEYLISLTVSDGMASSTATATIKISSPPSGFLPGQFVKREIKETQKPPPEKEIEKTEFLEKPQPSSEIAEGPTQTLPPPEFKKPKVAGAQKIQPKEMPSLFASLAQVFKEKPYLLFCLSLSLLALLTFLSWKIKKSLFKKKP